MANCACKGKRCRCGEHVASHPPEHGHRETGRGATSASWRRTGLEMPAKRHRAGGGGGNGSTPGCRSLAKAATCDLASMSRVPWKWTHQRWQVTVVPTPQPGLSKGPERTYFNFLLGPQHDRGEISPNIIISRKMLSGTIKREIH